MMLENMFKRDNYACVICDSSEDLQVDHIVSVWACTLGKISIAELNTSGNLQTAENVTQVKP